MRYSSPVDRERLSPYTDRVASSQAARGYLMFALAKAVSKTTVDARELLGELLGVRHPYGEVLTKAITPAMSSEAAIALDALKEEFGKLPIRPSLLGRLVGAREAPIVGLPIAVATEPAIAHWTGETEWIPVSVGTLDKRTLPVRKLGTIIPFTREAGRSEAGVSWIERDAVGAIVRGSDAAFVDGQPEDPDRPASILYGLTAIGGGSPADLEQNILDLVAAVSSGEAVAPHFIASATGARFLVSQRSGGARLFPDVALTGGSLYGVPLLVSPAASNKLVLVDAHTVLVFNGPIELDGSHEASLQLTMTPSSGAAETVSLWQAGLAAIRATRIVSWALSATDGAAYLELPV